MRHRAGHVRHAVEHRVVDPVGGIGVRGRVRVLEAAALVDGDVHQHRAGQHPGHQLVGDQHRRLGPGDQHRPDHQVGVDHRALDLVRVRGDRLAVSLVDRVGAAQPGDVLVH